MRTISTFLLGILSPALAMAQFQVTLEPVKDNTLYQDTTGSLSNGKGQYLFVGNTLTGSIRRGLLSFDVASAVPAGATITGVRLQLTMNMTIAAAENVTLHRCNADWGEGTSMALGMEGQGAPSSTGDATWLHTFFNTSNWQTPGGDFQTTPSATQSVAGNGPYTWGSTSALVADVQGWLDLPANNFGWVVLGNESVVTTAKRFSTRESPVPADRPQLIIDFRPLAASVASTGTGCVGSSNQALVLATTGLPTVPSATFAWTASGAPAGATVVNALGIGLLTPPIQLTPNCVLRIDPRNIFYNYVMVADGQGQASYPLPLPNNVHFLGFTFDAQLVGVDLPAPGALITSNALTMRLGG